MSNGKPGVRQELHNVAIPMTRKRLRAVSALTRLMDDQGASMGQVFARAIEQVYGRELDKIEKQQDDLKSKERSA